MIPTGTYRGIYLYRESDIQLLFTHSISFGYSLLRYEWNQWFRGFGELDVCLEVYCGVRGVVYRGIRESDDLHCHTMYQKTPYSNLHRHRYASTVGFHGSFCAFRGYILRFVHGLVYRGLLYNLGICLLHTPCVLRPYYTAILRPIPSNCVAPGFTR